MQIIQLGQADDGEDSYLASLDALEREPPDDAQIDRENAEGIALIVESSRLGKEEFAARYRRIWRRWYVTVGLLERWMTGATKPTLGEARRVYLMARREAKGKVAKHLSRTPALALGLAVALQLLDATLQLD